MKTTPAFRFVIVAILVLTAGCDRDTLPGTTPDMGPVASDMAKIAPDMTPTPDLAPPACTTLTKVGGQDVVIGHGQFGPGQILLAANGNTVAATWTSAKRSCSVVKTFTSGGTPLVGQDPGCVYGGDYVTDLAPLGVDKFVTSSLHYDNAGMAVSRVTIFDANGAIVAATASRISSFVSGKSAGVALNGIQMQSIDLLGINANATLTSAGNYTIPQGPDSEGNVASAIDFGGKIVIATQLVDSTVKGYGLHLLVLDDAKKIAKKFYGEAIPCVKVPMVGCVPPDQAVKLFVLNGELVAWTKNTYSHKESVVTRFDANLQPVGAVVTLPGDIMSLAPVRGGFAAITSNYSNDPAPAIHLKVYDYAGVLKSDSTIEQGFTTGGAQIVSTPDGHLATEYSPFPGGADVARFAYYVCNK